MKSSRDITSNIKQGKRGQDESATLFPLDEVDPGKYIFVVVTDVVLIIRGPRYSTIF